MAQLLTQTDKKSELKLRDYQEKVIGEIYQYFQNGTKRVLLYAPTGAGKTVIASSIIGDYVKQGKRVLFLVHRGKLVKQTCKTLYKFFGIDASVIWAEYAKPDYTFSVQIAMLQTIKNRELPPDIDLVILDEAHTASYFKVWSRILDTYAGKIWCLNQKVDFLGLSASPWRSKRNKEGYCQYFDEVVKAPYPSELIEKGHLSRGRQFAYTNLIDESKLKSKDGEFTQTSMAEVCDAAFNSEVVKIYLDKTTDIDRKPIAFCASVKQAKDLARQFEQCGVVAKCIVGNTRESERDKIFDDFTNNKTQLISSVGVLCEGFDEPSVNAILICRPIKSRALWVQICGRGLRTMIGKEDCWFFDYCGNIKRAGMPTQSFKIKLCPDCNDEQLEKTKTCPSCESEIFKLLAVCPHCGFEFKSDDPLKVQRRKRKFEEVLTPEQRKQVNYLKTIAVNSFNKQSNTNVDEKFKDKYGFYAPLDWFDGLLFGHVDGKFMGWEQNVQLYWRFLLNADPDNNFLNKHRIEREFKTVIKYTRKILNQRYLGKDITASQRDHLVNADISAILSYKPWWKIFGSNQPLDKEYLKNTYQVAVIKTETLYPEPEQRDIKNNILVLLATAYGEALLYHKQDKELLFVHIRFVREHISCCQFKAVENYTSTMPMEVKTRIWQSLSPQERKSYHDWKKLKSK